MNAFRTLPFSPQFAGRIVLALVVLLASLAWTSPAAQAAPQPETGAAPRLQAWIEGNQLHLAAARLPRNHIYFVRVRRTSLDSWVRLTRVRANQQGVVQKIVRLPSYLRRAERLNVCLKDVATGRTFCTRARRIN